MWRFLLLQICSASQPLHSQGRPRARPRFSVHSINMRGAKQRGTAAFRAPPSTSSLVTARFILAPGYYCKAPPLGQLSYDQEGNSFLWKLVSAASASAALASSTVVSMAAMMRDRGADQCTRCSVMRSR